MKNILNYQTSEYDCGPTTLTNAIRYLFDRESISPELLKAISIYTLDAFDDHGETGKSGTSLMAMKFISNWFNQYGKTKKFPIYSEFLEGNQVYIGQNSPIVGCLQQQGVVVAKVWLGDEGHYVLLTEIQEDKIGLFDPYYMEALSMELDIEFIHNRPEKINRKINSQIMNSKEQQYYAFGNIEFREAMLIYNQNTRKTPEKSIEYMI